MNNDYEDIFDKFFGHVRLASCSPKFAAPYGKKPEVTVSFTRVADDGTDELYEATGATSEEAMANLRAQLDDADEVTAQQHAKLWDNILEYAELASTSDVDEDFEEVESKLGPLADIIGSLIAEAIDEEDEDFYEDVYERLEALEDKVEALEEQRLELTHYTVMDAAAKAIRELNFRLKKLEDEKDPVEACTKSGAYKAFGIEEDRKDPVYLFLDQNHIRGLPLETVISKAFEERLDNYYFSKDEMVYEILKALYSNTYGSEVAAEEDDSIKVTPHRMTCLSNLLDDMLKAINDIIDRTDGLFTNPHEINRKAGGIRADLGVCKAMLEDIKND